MELDRLRPDDERRAAAAAWALAVAAVLTVATDARGEGYTVAAATGRIERRPADAGKADVDSVRPERASAVVPLPFVFRYHGRPCTTVVVSAHGWLLPGAESGFADAADPAAAHGQDPETGAFPYRADRAPPGASADGVVAPFWTPLAAVDDGTDGAGAVWTWTAGEAPHRRFVVSWEDVSAGTLGRVTVQAHLEEGPGTIVFAYAAGTVTGAEGPPPRCVCGLDSPSYLRFTAPADARGVPTVGLPPSDFVLTPRVVLANAPDAAKQGSAAAWLDERSTSLSGDGGARSCSYLGQGAYWFFVPDRATRSDAARARALAAEDLATFPPPRDARGARTTGDPSRWVRQVLDGKAVLLPDDDGPPVRLWFRVVEYFSVDDRGLAGQDDHVWNLRILLSMAFEKGDPRGDISRYCAWRASASGRLEVGKLFSANQTDDSGRQYDTGRAVEYVQWCARLKAGTRGAMPEDDCPVEGWKRFTMRKPDETDEQHADRRDVRWVPDPNYVASSYEYVVRSADAPDGWICRRRTRPRTMTDEPFDHDPPAER